MKFRMHDINSANSLLRLYQADVITKTELERALFRIGFKPIDRDGVTVLEFLPIDQPLRYTA